MNFDAARAQCLSQQVRAWEVLDDRVLGALQTIRRESFVPASERELAFADTEIPLGHGQSMMAPKLEGRLLQALQIEPSDEVLEIGTGSGYLTACLARLARHVTSVDLFADFVAVALARIREHGVRNVDVSTADGLTLSQTRQYDAIAVTGSMPTLTEHFTAMLKPYGRLFIVVGRPPVMEACVITQHPRGHQTRQDLFETVLTPLVNAERPEPFVL
jgi:protein-L-isoaspartate(D-aspartate) O-methyltransferase